MEEIAERAALRRIEVVAALYGLSGGIAMAWQRGWRPALSLTLVAGVSIVAFRTWEGVVRRLQPETAATARRPGESRYLLRWALLLAALGSAFVLGSRDLLALILGVTVLPLALITEAGLRILGLAPGAEGEE